MRVDYMALFQIIMLILVSFIVWFFYPLLFGAIWQPAPMSIVKRMLELAEVSPSDIVYDLGSGDGRVVIIAAKDFGARAIGVEIDPILVLLSRIKIRNRSLEGKAKVLQGNLFKKDIGDATVITVFLRKGANNSLREKFKKELKKNTRIVSYIHKFEGWEPVKFDEESQLFLYKT